MLDFATADVAYIEKVCPMFDISLVAKCVSEMISVFVTVMVVVAEYAVLTAVADALLANDDDAVMICSLLEILLTDDVVVCIFPDGTLIDATDNEDSVGLMLDTTLVDKKNVAVVEPLFNITLVDISDDSSVLDTTLVRVTDGL